MRAILDGLGLQRHPDKTRLVQLGPGKEGFDILGCWPYAGNSHVRFERGPQVAGSVPMNTSTMTRGLTMRLRRYIFNTLTVISLLLMLGTVGLWVRSYWVQNEIGVKDTVVGAMFASERRCIILQGGTLAYELQLTTIMPPITGKRQWQWYTQSRDDSLPVAETVWWFSSESSRGSGFGGNSLGQSWSTTHTTDHLYMPCWPLLLLFAFLPVLWLYKWNKRRTLGPNTCPTCDYDLTANESGICPECGANADPAEPQSPTF